MPIPPPPRFVNNHTPLQMPTPEDIARQRHLPHQSSKEVERRRKQLERHKAQS